MDWGNICDIEDSNNDLSFNINGASVICNQLGYSGALKFDTVNTTTATTSRYCIYLLLFLKILLSLTARQ